ncbi:MULTISPECIES: NADP-dependent oxidoreductase [unclassified Undibacterium]|uniref:NADP-dependent oxidoreductase n=1 Tax=unclassified Undibacterium TaxID=2630295 RepID=UPI002AC944D2|nr:MULTISPECIES: NADP-dependent oxidoreductase [unclassified Undibacterium]MEB0139161.1 NADP-dependent oxidoreductase [Undibacterium sp. CCC2.1]MEB0172859.1 NADP-dependent oxidoreductase [Undibacterium sp. CCC1.1]MEB0176669.1 NADP-dependent oxidoreductase [Undibacterium sp. CCC3.4]MEB0216003.1 NADP-dependent oxidoreductase [Undibacterium sp. 5I2]WPX43156.1 NADP-dependent oxidoreductase [Undibacterium sp. CCC3.4]
MNNTFQRIVLASRPQGQVTLDNFRLETVGIPVLGAGDVLVRNHYMSLDPYMRGRMEESKSYAAPQPLNETMIGGTVGVVAASNNARFAVGDQVIGMLGWTEMAISDGLMLRKLDTSHIPLSAYLGAVGMPGLTAWYGLTQIMHVKAGETVVVSAASGAVGSVVGQLAKQKGCRVVGIAGGAEKCAYVVDELGFDACVDYKAGQLHDDLAAATPNGIDAVFENVGGEIFDASLARMNPFGRIALCGMIAGYNGEAISIRNARAFLTMRLTLRGFIVSEHMDLWPQGLQELGTQVASGSLKFRESVADGIAAAPQAFIGLLKGQNFGKQLVKLV